MKKLQIIVRPSMLDAVRKALQDLGILGMNYTEIFGYGRQMGHTEVYRGNVMQVDFLPKLSCEVVLDDTKLEAAISAICEATRTGHVGDGKIFVTDVLDAIRIRTGERGNAAL